MSVQAQVINLLEDLQEEFGLTYLVVAPTTSPRHISDRVGVMYSGARRGGPADDLYTRPLHLCPSAAVGRAGARSVVEDQRERILLTGDLPSPANPPLRMPLPHPLSVAPADPVRHRATGAARRRHRRRPRGPRVACHWAEQIASGELRPHEVEAIAVEQTALVDEAGSPIMGPTSIGEIG